MNAAIIPTRGKRISQKNLKLFCVKSIIAHSILSAKKSKLFDRIIFSTDNDKIAQTAVAWVIYL